MRKSALKYSGTWAAAMGAMSLIINAVPSIAIFLLLIIVPLSLIVPAIISYFVIKNNPKGKIDKKSASKQGTEIGIIYAIVMVGVALIFIIFNYLVIAIVWADIEVMIEGILVVLATLIIGLPVLGIISVIMGRIGAMAANKNSESQLGNTKTRKKQI